MLLHPVFLVNITYVCYIFSWLRVLFLYISQKWLIAKWVVFLQLLELQKSNFSTLDVLAAVFRGFPLSLQAYAGIVPQATATSFQILSNSFVILSFDAL
jgi:hypothetical protein